MRSVQHTLSSMAPKVFTMQLAWQSANETKQDIAQTLGGLQEVCSQSADIRCTACFSLFSTVSLLTVRHKC